MQVGAYGSRLLATENSFFTTFKPDQTSTSLERVDALDRRNRLDYGWNGGVGAFYKINQGHVFLSAN